MSKTWTQFECERCAESRASSRNIPMNCFFSERCGRTRLMATVFLNPSSPALSARNTSAMPPEAIFSMTLYRCCWAIAICRVQADARFPGELLKLLQMQELLLRKSWRISISSCYTKTTL